MSIDNPLWVDVTILVLAFAFSALSLAFTRTGKRWLHYLRLAILWVDVQFQNWAKRRRAKKEPTPTYSATVAALAEMYKRHYHTIPLRTPVDYSKLERLRLENDTAFKGMMFDLDRKFHDPGDEDNDR